MCPGRAAFWDSICQQTAGASSFVQPRAPRGRQSRITQQPRGAHIQGAAPGHSGAALAVPDICSPQHMCVWHKLPLAVA